MVRKEIADRIEGTLKQLEEFTSTPGNGCTRLPFTKEARGAVEFLKARMKEVGLSAYEDQAGNIIGVLEGEDPGAPCVMMGSHYDSVIHRGNYDGSAGVVNAIETARLLKARGCIRKRNFVVVGFCDEEGTRFGNGFFGSGAILGKYDIDYCRKFKDTKGISIYDAMKEYGLDPERIGEASWKQGSIGCFLESHIEQGPVLENSGTELGLVDCIVGLQRYMVTVHGRADHAGTTPMTMRRDAMETASKVISKIPEWARELDDGTVATVGYVNVIPGGINIVAEKVIFSVDIRSRSNRNIERIAEKMRAMLTEVSEAYGSSYEIDTKLKIRPLHLAEELLASLEEACQKRGFSYKRMSSGAGHDTLKIGQEKIPSVIVFVASKGGRSHCPAEWSDCDDLAKAVLVTADLTEKLLGE